jgi:hypothetical protein
MMKLQRPALVVACVLLLACGVLQQDHALAAKDAPTESQAKDWITKWTGIRACRDPKYTFTQLQFAQPVRRTIQYSQKPVQLYPVHTTYSVECIYGDEQMHVDVDMTFAFYKDAFGNWKNFGPGFREDQTWANTQNDLRCRAQDVAAVTFGPDGKVAGRTPAKDTTYIGCRVIPEEN